MSETKAQDQSRNVDYVTLCAKADVPLDEPLRVEIQGLCPLAVIRFQDQYYVVDDTCTHGSASLSDGEIEGEEVICPFHRGAFNFRTGEATASPCSIPLRTHAVFDADSDVVIVAPAGHQPEIVQ